MKSKYVIAIGAAILVGALFLSRDKKNKSVSVENEPDEVEMVARETGPRQVTPPASAPPPRPVPRSSDVSTVADSEVSVGSELPEVIKKRVSAQINYMNKCLGLNGARGAGASAEPTMDALMDQLRPSMGDSVNKVEDWTQTEIVDTDGVRTRVRVDYDYAGEGAEPMRRLSVYKINAYGMPEIVSLTPDQADNPNEAYVNSLVEGKKVTGEESSARLYFSNGEEVIFSMRNGYINTLNVTRGVRSFNCQNLDEERSDCLCQ